MFLWRFLLSNALKMLLFRRWRLTGALFQPAAEMHRRFAPKLAKWPLAVVDGA
jgi:hypothetical protein